MDYYSSGLTKIACSNLFLGNFIAFAKVVREIIVANFMISSIYYVIYSFIIEIYGPNLHVRKVMRLV
jgi:hypothetical protein